MRQQSHSHNEFIQVGTCTNTISSDHTRESEVV